MKSSCLLPLICALFPMSAKAAIILIDADTRNGSFELLGGAPSGLKATNWDTDPDGDVDSWTIWPGVSTASGDSGTDLGASASNGVRVAFLEGQNAVFNLTTYIVQPGDTFTFTWDHVLRDGRSSTVSLVYEDGLGNIVLLSGSDVTNTDVALGLTNTFTIGDDSPAIGMAIGLGIKCNGTSGDNSYPELDNFVLSVESVPEPSVTALCGLGVLFFSIRGRRRVRLRHP